MSKALLILPEMPEKCLRCDFGYDQGETVCCSRLEKSVERTVHRPNCCPLRPIPEKVTEALDDGSFADGVNCGWNACLIAIGGSEEDDN